MPQGRHSELHGNGDAVLLAPMAVFSTLDRVRLCTILGVLIAALSPLVSMIDRHELPWVVQAYFVPSYNYFSFFPWASFLAFGMAAGSVFRAGEEGGHGEGDAVDDADRLGPDHRCAIFLGPAVFASTPNRSTG